MTFYTVSVCVTNDWPLSFCIPYKYAKTSPHQYKLLLAFYIYVAIQLLKSIAYTYVGYTPKYILANRLV